MKRLARYLMAKARHNRYPHIIELRDFDPEPLLFEVTNPIEEYRVAEHGGETIYTSLMLDRLVPGDVVYDIGACIGLVTLHAVKRGVSVIAFEPDPSFRQRIERNALLNQCHSSFTLLPYAISATDGVVTLYTQGVSGMSPSIRHQRGEEHSLQVPARSLDSLVKEGLRPPTVLKLDIEGAEILALRGAKNLLASPDAPRAIFLELHPDFLPAFGATAQEVLDLLARNNYQVSESASRGDQTHLILEHRPS